MGGGTEAFPDLGDHCQHDDCHQFDFLPFTCEACGKIFCLEHRTYRAHGCPSADRGSRTVAVCQICSATVEKEEGEDDESAVSRHERSGGCDASRKRKLRCPVPRCKEVLTFSNCTSCKVCGLKVCLKHRFSSDHACRMTRRPPAAAAAAAAAAMKRSGVECREKKEKPGVVSQLPSPPIKGY
ncbi:Zinc finger AN1 domain-containing stress-associated protein 12 [Apostasia shenzhenica]|uniref:Zinc finger AN1 domain-containing stress-associated protein 12 n=1 Tax=Apostasia shenzhenica TaxID=1088818 RepID=A0A2H9ZX77_9ASPA|nr:Zinc finger AN1 domain-containing stress-associated protein 12 [Apostasia shenzhenica]